MVYITKINWELTYELMKIPSGNFILPKLWAIEWFSKIINKNIQIAFIFRGY